MKATTRALLLVMAGIIGGHVGANVDNTLINVSIGAALTVLAYALFVKYDREAKP